MYIISNGEHWLRIADNGGFVSTDKINMAACFMERTKAENAVKNLPKSLKNLGFFVEEICTETTGGMRVRPEIKIETPEEYPSYEIVLSTTKNFINMKEYLISSESSLELQLTYLEHLQNDILHSIEFYNMNACEGFKMYKRLQEVRRERRKIKDLLLIISILEESDSDIVYRIEKIKDRKYKVRADDELFKKDDEVERG